MAFELDVSKLSQAAARKVTTHDNCVVLDVGTGSFPRYIEVRLPDDDGARQTAIWDGSIDLAVNDVVICNEYASSPVWRVAATGGADSGAGKVRVSSVWESDFGAVALQADATGQIGIGTATPGENLDVAAALTGAAGSHAAEPVVRITQTADTTYNIGDVHSGLEFYTEDANGPFPGIQAYIRAVTTRANGISAPDAGLVFGVSASGGLGADSVIIQGNGNVGIGTTSPTSPLDVNGVITLSGSTGNILRDVDSAATRMLAATALTTGASLEFYGRDHGSLPGKVFLTYGGYDADGSLAIRHVNTAGSFSEKVIVDLTGQVGIGTTSPQGRLHFYDTISGGMHWEYDGLDATVRTIIPNGTGDALYNLFGMYNFRDSAGAVASSTFSVANGGSTGLPVGGNTVTVAVAGTGAITVSRTAGTDTIKVTFILLWL